MIINYSFFNINLSFYLFKLNSNNVSSFNLIISNKYKMNFIYMVNFPRISRYNWCNNISRSLKTFKVNFLNIIKTNNFFFKKKNLFEKINNIVFFKKKSILIKKNADYEFTILNRINSGKEEFRNNSPLKLIPKKKKLVFNNNNNYNFNYIKFKKNKTNKLNNFNNKFIDFKKKINLIFNQNRFLLRKILKVKFKRQYNFNKYIKNLTKLNQLNFLHNFEYRISSLLVRSLFFYNYNDCIWFIKNGYVTIDGFVTNNYKKKIKPLQVVNILVNKYNYYYYRFMVNNCTANLYRFNSKIRKINFHRFNKDGSIEKFSPWVFKYINYREDIPKFLEIDYISMSLIMLNYSFEKNFLDFYNIKFLNLYLNRLYNWKKII